MCFVNHDGVVLPEQAVLAELLQQDTVRHHLDGGFICTLFPETNFRRDKFFVLEFFAQAIGNGNRRQTPRLGNANLKLDWILRLRTTPNKPLQQKLR